MSGKLIFTLTFLIILTSRIFAFQTAATTSDENILSYTVDLQSQNIHMYWKDDKGNILQSIQRLKAYVESKKSTLIFATNGGMYQKDHSPQGLFIQKNKILHALDTLSGNGNFYLKPNGVFYITDDKKAAICPTSEFVHHPHIQYATQSGPMLVINGKIHSAFREGSTNVNIRNGVGILPNNKVVFAMSKADINFYDFANYFKNIGCKNALFLDGFVSRTYLPEQKWLQTDGTFGVMIGVTK